jgi:hypothetical protein
VRSRAGSAPTRRTCGVGFAIPSSRFSAGAGTLAELGSLVRSFADAYRPGGQTRHGEFLQACRRSSRIFRRAGHGTRDSSSASEGSRGGDRAGVRREQTSGRLCAAIRSGGATARARRQ